MNEERKRVVDEMCLDLVLSRVIPHRYLFARRKRLAEALVARGWRKVALSDSAAEVAAMFMPPRARPLSDAPDEAGK